MRTTIRCPCCGFSDGAVLGFDTLQDLNMFWEFSVHEEFVTPIGQYDEWPRNPLTVREADGRLRVTLEDVGDNLNANTTYPVFNVHPTWLRDELVRLFPESMSYGAMWAQGTQVTEPDVKMVEFGPVGGGRPMWEQSIQVGEGEDPMHYDDVPIRCMWGAIGGPVPSPDETDDESSFLSSSVEIESYSPSDQDNGDDYWVQYPDTTRSSTPTPAMYSPPPSTDDSFLGMHTPFNYSPISLTDEPYPLLTTPRNSPPMEENDGYQFMNESFPPLVVPRRISPSMSSVHVDQHSTSSNGSSDEQEGVVLGKTAYWGKKRFKPKAPRFVRKKKELRSCHSSTH